MRPRSGRWRACTSMMGPYEDTVEPPTAGPQVKSLTFVTLRHVLSSSFVEVHGDRTLAAVVDSLDPAAREALQGSEPGAWIDERLMLNVMETILMTAFGGDLNAFRLFVRELAGAGISRFLKIFLSLTSARFALRRVPVVWNHLRRNAGTVTAQREGADIRLMYTGFPFFGHEAYRVLSVANCEALAVAAGGNLPNARIERWSSDSLQLYFELGAV